MKVVLFCGGYGMRMRDGDGEGLPKPMQMVGPRPLIWHVMRWYAHYGHTDFVLCLGYGAEHVKNFFLGYRETASNDFRLHEGRIDLLKEDISNWSITFVDTGLETPIGERLRRVRDHLDEQPFFANYADVLSDVDLDAMLETFVASGAAATLMTVQPSSSFHFLESDDDGTVTRIRRASELPLATNGGFFILTQEVFDHLPEGGDLVEDACASLAAEGRLLAIPHDGFWMPADTFKERAELDRRWIDGDRPWAAWEQ